MTEPLSPAAAGVASVLKSLRTCAGLREDRLHGTELALDTLAGLDSVRERMRTGESAERAIVQVVQAAARDLEPTLSIVADASLGLHLSSDTDLYSGDLGRRRDVLLRNWDRLHELRSVPAWGTLSTRPQAGSRSHRAQCAGGPADQPLRPHQLLCDPGAAGWKQSVSAAVRRFSGRPGRDTGLRGRAG